MRGCCCAEAVVARLRHGTRRRNAWDFCWEGQVSMFFVLAGDEWAKIFHVFFSLPICAFVCAEDGRGGTFCSFKISRLLF